MAGKLFIVINNGEFHQLQPFVGKADIDWDLLDPDNKLKIIVNKGGKEIC